MGNLTADTDSRFVDEMYKMDLDTAVPSLKRYFIDSSFN